MKEKIIKILKEGSLGKATAVIESLDLGIYIWRKDLFVLKDGEDLEFNEIQAEEQEGILKQVEAGNWYPSKSFQV